MTEDVGKSRSVPAVDQTAAAAAAQYYGTFQGVANYPPLQRLLQAGAGLPQPAPPLGAPPYYSLGYQTIHTVPGYAVAEGRPVDERRLPCCGIGIGWLLFLSGFLFGTLPWYIGTFVLLCARVDYREKPGLIACTLAAVLSVIAISLGVTKATHAWYYNFWVEDRCRSLATLIMVLTNCIPKRLTDTCRPLKIATTPSVFKFRGFGTKLLRMKIFKKMGNHHMTNDIQVHGILFWVSIGLLMPLGIITIRMSNIKKFRRWVKLLFYFHAILQTGSVLLATAGAVLSIRNFENAFNNHHQRIGLAIYVAIWVQALTGFRRPRRGSKSRSLWYIVHWILGTVISIVGIFNIYTGLQAYHKRTSKDTSFLVVLFTSQIIFMAFLYLLQDKWDYIKRNGIISDDVPSIPRDREAPQTDNVKELPTEPSRKSNSLQNFFAKRNALKKLFQST